MTLVNPQDQQSLFRQGKLASLLAGKGIHPDSGLGQAQAVDDTQAQQRAQSFAGDLANTQASATAQSNNYIAAVQQRAALDEQARQQKLWADQMKKIAAAKASGSLPNVNGSGLGAAFGSGGKTSGGKLVGPYELTSSANNAYNKLAAAYKAAGYGNLSVISGGRTYAEQQRLYQAYLNGTGNLAAKPGTSVHESGRAVDFGGAAHSAGTAAHKWLEANASKYGWSWTGKNFSQFEPWHFEYTG